MFRTERMSKLRVICLEKDKKNVIKNMHQAGAMDLRNSTLELNDDKPSEGTAEISDALIKVSGALSILKEAKVKHGKKGPRIEKVEKSEMSETIEIGKLLKYALEGKEISTIYSIDDRLRELGEDKKELESAKKTALLFYSFKIPFSYFRSETVEYRAFELGKKQLKEFLNETRKEKQNIDYEIKPAAKGNSLVVIAYPKSDKLSDSVEKTIANEIDLHAKYLDGTAHEVAGFADRRLKEHANEEKRLNGELLKLANEHYSKLAGIKEMLEIELERSEVSAIFKKTESAFVVEGWVPAKQVNSFESSIKAATNGKYLIEKVEDDELAPTLLGRPKFLQPFDYLVNFFSVPRSDEIDPTWIFIFSFAIFYGLMVTDAGYGLLSLLFVTYVAKITDPEGLVHNAAKIWQITSISAIFFGIISNQYFGFGLDQYLIPGFKGFNWLGSVTTIISITVIFGIIQVCIGLLFGFINNKNRGHTKLAYSKLTSIAAIVLGTIALSATFFGQFNYAVAEYTGILAIAALLLTAILSGQEASELTNLITHPLSYTRIMGFGLGSVIIALLIDQAFTPNMSGGILLFIVYTIIFIALHFLNMILAIFEGIVQGVRLNFVEFFSKFYIGNGIRFRPFAEKRVRTKEK